MQLDDAITGLDGRDDVGCMVLTGADPAFCAGMDLKSLSTELRSVQQERQRRPARRIGMMPPHATPVIGAINGPTVTGGLELALCCDFLIASERARFADTHARVGVMPGGGMTIRLPQLIGIDRARRMSFTGDYIDAEHGTRLGAGGRGGAARVVAGPGARARVDHRVASPPTCVRELRRGYEEIGAMAGEAAFAAETEWSREWMEERFDQSTPVRRTREHRGPGPGAEHGARRHAA